MRTVCTLASRPWRFAVAVVAALSLGVDRVAAADESISLYFDQLRSRNLFSLAESYAMSRLSHTNLTRPRRTQFIIELSKTLAQHAEFASEQQQQELWSQAKSVVEEQRAREPDGPFDLILAGQSAMVLAGEAEWLRVECELRPFDEPLADRIRQQCTAAIEKLMAAERLFVSPGRDVTTKNSLTNGPSTHELRVMLHRVRLALAQSLRTRAELSAKGSHQRSVDLADAEVTARKLNGGSDEPIQSRAKLMLIACARLKGDLDSADKMLAALEKSATGTEFGLSDEIATQRVLGLLERRQAPDALRQILQIRSKQKRLTGELWFLSTRALVAMRDVAAQRKDSELSKKLSDEAEITLQRCDDQVGGFWSRRCRQLWDATQATEKYGPELDRLMQQARADFLANRIEPALNAYSRAERIARAAGQPDLAFDLGYTRSSILLREKNYEAGAEEFLRLSNEYSNNARAAAAHLNGAYCLGRMYDDQKTQSRRETYSNALDEQIDRFAADPTADDARFFKAQLEEQRLQSTVALPLYLKLDKNHPRYSEARAGAARCYESILVRMRERKIPTDEFLRTALAMMTQFLGGQQKGAIFLGAQEGDIKGMEEPQCEVALHLAAIYLMSEPAEFAQAEQLLSRIIKTTSQVPAESEQMARWKRLKQRAEALRVVALAGRGQPDEALRLVDSLGTASPRDLAMIVERLGSLIDTPNRQLQIQYVNLLLHAAELLAKHGSTLSKGEQDQLDRALGRAYLASGQSSKALDLYRKQAEATSKDANRQREIATLVSTFDQREFAILGRECWRRVELLTKQGSADWLAARLGVISTTIQLNEMAEARRLMGITKLLYPELGGSDLKQRFVALERAIEAKLAVTPKHP